MVKLYMAKNKLGSNWLNNLLQLGIKTNHSIIEYHEALGKTFENAVNTFKQQGEIFPECKLYYIDSYENNKQTN